MKRLGIDTPHGKLLAITTALALAGTSAVIAKHAHGSSPALGALPDAHLTPGKVERLSASYLCTHTTATRRNVSDLTKIAVFKRYNVPLPTKGERAGWEVDHLVPLALGGTNDVTNLWPEKAPGFHKKDALEVRLRNLVCAHKLDLAVAQRAIATDWTAAYRTYVGDSTSLSGPANE